MEPLKLLIYVDESLASRRAVQLVAPLAKAGSSGVVLLSNESNEEQAQSFLDEAAELLGMANVERRVRPDALVPALIREVREHAIDLVVIAPPKRAPWQRWLRGGEAESLARHVPTSLLLVRGRPVQTTLESALIGAAGGRSVLDDAGMAARVLAPIGGQAVICHVVSQVPMVYGPRSTHEQLMHHFLETGSQEIENMRSAVEILKDAGVSAQLKLRVGAVVDEVLEELREGCYNTLVVGAHHAASMLERLLLEDLSADLLIKSPVPVLLVRPRE